MRIAQVAPFGVHPYSGVLAAIVSVSVELARRGHAVEVWQLHDWPLDETGGFARELDSAGVNRVPLRVKHGRWVIEDSIKKTVLARRVDLVHLHNAFSLPNNVIASALGVPYVVSPHGGYAPAVLRRHLLRKRLFLLARELPMLHRAAMVFALTEAERRDVHRLGVRERVTVIPNGVDTPPTPLDRRTFRHSLGIALDQRLVVFVGRLDVYYKRLDVLLEGIASVPDWTLALVGPDWKGSLDRLHRLIDDFGLRGRAHIVGAKRGEELWRALAAADVVALLSRSEGMPLGLLDGLACGVPAVVSAEVEEAVGVVEQGAGWLAPPEQVGAVLRSIAVAEPQEWAQRRQAALRMASRFSWPEVAAEYETALHEVLHGGRSR